MNEETKPNSHEPIAQESLGISNIKFTLGAIFLLIAIAASFILSGKHLGLLEAPGCGEGGGCEKVLNSAWAKLPIVDWPVAFVGLAYFTSLLLAWISAKKATGVPWIIKNIVRVGAILSAMFIVVMAYSKSFCPYCAATHLANFGFLAVIELSSKNSKSTLRAIAWATTAFVIVTVSQFGALTIVKQESQVKTDKSTEEIIKATTEDRPPRFTGRYTFGPADAPIRIVVFSDYSCQNCQIIDHELDIILARRDDVSVSPKHYPFCTDCNSHVKTTAHYSACRAARAAEAAGLIGGLEAFEEMHKWLFLKSGIFREDELKKYLEKHQIDYNEFKKLMYGKEVLALIRADTDEGKSIGLTHTPLVFINGIELHGTASSGTVMRAVARIAKTNPTSNSSANDRPVSAHERYIQQWRLQTTKIVPEDSTSWAIGTDNPSVTITVWGDYLESETKETDGILREITNSRSDVKYVYRHFPANMDCNPEATKTINPMACRAALAAEAAGKIAGSRGFWEMHEWLMGLQDALSDDLLRSAAKSIGIDPDKLLDEMEAIDTSEALKEDVTAAQKLNAKGIPWILVNGKRVQSWRLEGFNILKEIVEEAASGQK